MQAALAAQDGLQERWAQGVVGVTGRCLEGLRDRGGGCGLKEGPGGSQELRAKGVNVGVCASETGAGAREAWRRDGDLQWLPGSNAPTHPEPRSPAHPGAGPWEPAAQARAGGCPWW